jgi:HEAT repeat protein
MSAIFPEVSIVNPQDDPRTADELLLVALCDSDEDRAWEAICALHWRGTREILDRAVQLCTSDCAVERRTGAHILGQLGLPDRTFPGECLSTLLSMLATETRADVLRPIIVALSHLHQPESIAPVSRFRHHSEADVRHAVVLVLSGFAEPAAVAVLIELARDPVAHVRDWATFGLGTLLELDTPEIRTCLMERISDPDDNTRSEAIVGLAERRDRRVLPALRKELQSESVQPIVVEAAELLGDPQLYADLLALQTRWGVDDQQLANAIAACSRSGKICEK